jgi:hypothetical protein
MYCWPPSVLIYIEKGESPFIHHHHCTLFFVLVFLEEVVGIYEKTLGEL